MGHTLIEKIIGASAGREVRPGDIVTVNVDRVMLDDIMMPFIVSKFSEMGFTKVWDPEKVVIICDHLVPASQIDDTRAYKISCDFAEEQGINNLHRSDGILFQRKRRGFAALAEIVLHGLGQRAKPLLLMEQKSGHRDHGNQ